MEQLTHEELDLLERLNKKRTPGKIHPEDFCIAPASEKHPAIHTKKLRPVQRTALGSFKAIDADFYAAANLMDKLHTTARRGMENAWRDIESAPKDGSTILAYSSERPGYGIQYVYWSQEGRKWHNAYSGYPLEGENKLTSWQPRPAPPQTSESST